MRRRSSSLLALTLVGALALAGCAGATDPEDADEPFPTSFTAPPPTPVATPEPEPVDSALPAEIAGVDTSGWQQVTPPEGTSATFRIPPDWTTEDAADGLRVLRADGQQRLQLTIVPSAQAQVGDGRCLDAAGAAVAWRTMPLDQQPVSIAGAADVAYGAAALELGGTWIVGIGLVPGAAAQTPRCPIVHAFEAGGSSVSFGTEPIVQGSGAGSGWVVGSLEEAQAFVGSEEYAQIRAIVMSLELVDA